MTLVLSMNPEGDAGLSSCPRFWDGPDSPCCCCSERRYAPEPPDKTRPDSVSMSRIHDFKRKFVDDNEDSRFSFRTFCQTVGPVLERRTHVLRLSLEKMRVIDDPEVFLRRSVLVNNLLCRLRAEILLQNTDWAFPPNAPLNSAPCILPPGSTHHAPPLKKRLRIIAGPGELRPRSCCCVYEPAAGHFLHLPLSVYVSSCPSDHNASFQLDRRKKLGWTEEYAKEEGEESDKLRDEGSSAVALDRFKH